MASIPCAGAIVVDGTGRLLHVERATPPQAGRWTIPGGRVEPGETIEQAVAREVLEETGLVVDVGPRVGTVERPGPGGVTYEIHDHAATPTGGTPQAGDDAAALRWASPAELAGLPLVTGLLAQLQEWGVVPAQRST